jgi:hypothetical protein
MNDIALMRYILVRYLEKKQVLVMFRIQENIEIEVLFLILLLKPEG